MIGGSEPYETAETRLIAPLAHLDQVVRPSTHPLFADSLTELLATRVADEGFSTE